LLAGEFIWKLEGSFSSLLYDTLIVEGCLLSC